MFASLAAALLLTHAPLAQQQDGPIVTAGEAETADALRVREAVAYAKTEAVRSGCSVVVAQTKTCVSNNATIGIVEVKGSERGRWQFSGEGMC